jgi:hypothetical protein
MRESRSVTSGSGRAPIGAVELIDHCRPIAAALRFQRREVGHKVVAEAVLGGLHHLYRDAT